MTPARVVISAGGLTLHERSSTFGLFVTFASVTRYATVAPYVLCSCPAFSGGRDLRQNLYGASALGDDADRTNVERLANPVDRGLSLAFPRRRTTECREAILSVDHDAIRKPKLCLPATWSAVTASAVQGGTRSGPRATPDMQWDTLPDHQRPHRLAPLPFGPTLAPPPNGGIWRVTPVNRTPKKVARIF